MITRLEVDGFKSLRNFAVDLEPFTVFIGPNSAGKSNILDALALLSRLASQPLTEAFKNGRGRPIDQFTRHGGESAKQMRFAVELLEYGDYPEPVGRPDRQGFQSRYRYQMTVERQVMASGAERLAVKDERLTAMRREDDPWIASHPEFAAVAGYIDAGEAYLVTLNDQKSPLQRVVTMPSRYAEEVSIPQAQTALMSTNVGDSLLVRGNFTRSQFLHPEAAKLGEASDPTDTGDLARDASNLPSVLATLPESVLGEIRVDLVAMVPGVASFDVIADSDAIRIEFELSGGERVPARLVSDGTLRILALLTALRMEPRPYLICVEEPENGIYPGRLRALLELLRETTACPCPDPSDIAAIEARYNDIKGFEGFTANLLPRQILLTTHSPVVLKALRAHPQHLRFVDIVRRDGERVTRARPVGKSGSNDRGRTTISPREIDLILHAADSEQSQ